MIDVKLDRATTMALGTALVDLETRRQALDEKIAAVRSLLQAKVTKLRKKNFETLQSLARQAGVDYTTMANFVKHRLQPGAVFTKVGKGRRFSVPEGARILEAYEVFKLAYNTEASKRLIQARLSKASAATVKL